MMTKDVTKEFPSVFLYCQSKRNVISLLAEVTIENDMSELDAKSCSQLLTVENIKVMSFIHR